MNVENINAIVDSLATKLAVPTEYILSMLIRQGKFSIAYSVITFSIGVILLFSAYIFYKKYQKIESWESNKREFFLMVTLFCFIPSVFLFGLFIFSFIDSVNWIIDPEAYAFKEIMYMLRRGGN